ncbi:MAG: hypothetical protein IJY11_00880 [Clostridia bacterium]|nr:hypothetical protein [Clostridia bacterium]
MEIFVLLMLYYLSQNPDFLARVKPLMGEMKNSQEMLKFITDLSKFASIFNQTAAQPSPEQPKKEEKKQEEDKKTPASQTSGIADEFIQQCLENYFKKR